MNAGNQHFPFSNNVSNYSETLSLLPYTFKKVPLLRDLSIFLTLSVSSTSLQSKSFENTPGNREIARREQFLLFPLCCLPIWKTFCYFHQIKNCCLQTLSFWKILKYVVWERVKALMVFIAIGFILLRPFTIVKTMVIWESNYMYLLYKTTKY